jgi:hypothetical protein
MPVSAAPSESKPARTPLKLVEALEGLFSDPVNNGQCKHMESTSGTVDGSTVARTGKERYYLGSLRGWKGC